MFAKEGMAAVDEEEGGGWRRTREWGAKEANKKDGPEDEEEEEEEEDQEDEDEEWSIGLEGDWSWKKVAVVATIFTVVLLFWVRWDGTRVSGFASSVFTTGTATRQEEEHKDWEDVEENRHWACPMFHSLSPFAMDVFWSQPAHLPSAFSIVYRLYVGPAYPPQTQQMLATQKLVYRGTELSKRVEDLKPGTIYEAKLEIANARLSGEEVLASCSRHITTPGRESDNLLFNPSFELIREEISFGGANTGGGRATKKKQEWAVAWEPLMMAYSLTHSSATSHQGDRSLSISSPDEANKWGAAQWVFLNKSSSTPLTLAAWSRAKGVSGNMDSGYSVSMDIKYQDGTFLYGQSLEFDTGTHSWQKKCLVVPPVKPIEAVSVYVLFYQHTGSVWFDDISLTVSNWAKDKVSAGLGGDGGARSPHVIFAGWQVDECQYLHHPMPVALGCCERRETLPALNEPKYDDVAIVTQLTTDRLYALRLMAETWGGPISAAVFLLRPESEIMEIKKLQSSSEMVRNNVDFHLVFSNEEGQYGFHTLGLYPVNTLRNVAMNRSRTGHALVLDVDFVTSFGARDNLRKMWMQLHIPHTAFVVPAFEMPNVDLLSMPQTKEKLVEMARNGYIKQVHRDKWYPAHGPTNYAKWYVSKEAYDIKHQKDYEPYMLLRKDAPG
ncbi:Glycosyltransferase-like 1B, variant 2 [Balamuthia mandrillaris]